MANTYKNILGDLTDFKNLLLAAAKAQKGKRMKQNTAKFNFFLEKELLKLQAELLNQTYQPGRYRHFYVYEPKPRLISAAPYRDRVVHHAFCNIVEPIFDKTFIYDSYACRIGKGTHMALDRAQKFLRANKYVLQCDIQKYFPSINYDILLSIITKKIKDKKVLWLAKRIIESANSKWQIANSKWEKTDTISHKPYATSQKGIPIGNLASQFFAKLYLNELDYFIKFGLREKYYICYMDDFLLFGNDKVHLINDKKAEIARFLESRLKLKIHPKKSIVFPAKAGIGFLGFRLFNSHRRLKKENVKRFLKRMKRQKAFFLKGLISIKRIRDSLQYWNAHASYGNTYRLRKLLFERFVI